MRRKLMLQGHPTLLERIVDAFTRKGCLESDATILLVHLFASNQEWTRVT